MNKPNDVRSHVDKTEQKKNYNNMIVQTLTKCSIDQEMIKIEDAA